MTSGQWAEGNPVIMRAIVMVLPTKGMESFHKTVCTLVPLVFLYYFLRVYFIILSIMNRHLTVDSDITKYGSVTPTYTSCVLCLTVAVTTRFSPHLV